MTSWTDGYVAELDYTHGYYREMSPLMLQLAMLSKLQDHRVSRPVRYLELGFGQGVSLNIHAAACEGEFWGTDFNPSQTANARDLAAASCANVRLLDDSFAEFAKRDDLPEFDIIVLHGIWSWISDESRQVIADIARRKLSVGGILYVSYNCTPGWSASMPLRHLMTLHLQMASGEAMGMVPRIDAALNFAQQVVDSNALYFRANPVVAERLKTLKGHNRNYLAHEFFNAEWHPMPFSDVAGYLDAAKLSFAASSNLLAHIDMVNLTPAQQQLLAQISNPVLRESVRDYCENQQFRRDIFVKGPRAQAAAKQAATLRAQRFMLTTHESDIALKISGNAGEAQLQHDIYRPVIAALAADTYRPKTVDELMGMPELKAITFTQLAQALIVLTGLQHASPAQDQGAANAARRKTDALNAHILERALHSMDIVHLASPVTGGGVAINRLQQLILRSIMRNKNGAQDIALDVWPILEAQGQRMMKDGKAIMNAAENLAELTRVVAEFMTKRLPILGATQVVPERSEKFQGSGQTDVHRAA